MYCLSEKQIDYIFNDIRARGVEMESMQLNLHDHICCIIEQNLEEHGDFESFYQKTIRTFYKDELWEIEEETLLLLTYKNYYAMKKTMILSGTCSAAAMILGIIFKFMHWPGASAFIILGIGTSSLIFLPLLFILKSKDRHQTKDKIILGIGILSGILLSLSILFKVMHWPYATILGYSSVILIGLFLLPIFFITGIKNPENKINTITISIVMIMVCGLWLTLIISPKGMKIMRTKNTTAFIVNEKIVSNEKKLYTDFTKIDSVKSDIQNLTDKIIEVCDHIKTSIVLKETGVSIIPIDFETKELYIGNNGFNFDENQQAQIDSLTALIKNYNSKTSSQKTATANDRVEFDPSYEFYHGSNIEVLNQLSQIQLIVLQNERL